MSQGQPPALAPSGSEAQQPTAEALAQPGQAEGACQMVRKEDLGCAICLETLKDPFVTACGKYRPPPPPLLPLTPLPAAHLCSPHCSAAALNCIPCTLPTASQIPPTSPPPLSVCRSHLLLCLPVAAPAARQELPRLLPLPRHRPHLPKLPPQQGEYGLHWDGI
jgi:hypothetical protein